MSSYSPPPQETTKNGRGVQILLILLGLILLAAVQIRSDQQLLKISPLPDGGVLLVVSIQELTNSDRKIMTIAINEGGKILWKRQYKHRFVTEELNSLQVIPEGQDFLLQINQRSIYLDERGKEQDKTPLQELQENQNEINSSSTAPETIESLSHDGIEYRLSPETGLVKAYEQDSLLWIIDTQKEFQFLGENGRDQSLELTKKGLLQLHMSLTASKEYPEGAKEHSFRFSVTIDKDGNWLTDSFRQENIKNQGGDLGSQSDFVPGNNSLNHNGITYSIRKGLLKAEDSEGQLLWKKQVYFPILALLEDYF